MKVGLESGEVLRVVGDGVRYCAKINPIGPLGSAYPRFYLLSRQTTFLWLALRYRPDVESRNGWRLVLAVTP
jgi:hypothetical protein